MCRGATPAEIELVEKDEDVTTILVDDDKWDELASDTPQGAYSRKPIVTLCFAMFANSVALTNVFPYAGFMILHYGLTEDETRVGFYAGYLMTLVHGRSPALELLLRRAVGPHWPQGGHTDRALELSRVFDRIRLLADLRNRAIHAIMHGSLQRPHGRRKSSHTGNCTKGPRAADGHGLRGRHVARGVITGAFTMSRIASMA